MNKLDIYLFADDSIIIEIKPEYDGNELSKLYKDLTSVSSLLESVSKKPLFDYKSLKFDLSKSIGAEIKDVQNLMDKIRAKEMFPGDGKEISSLMNQIKMGANGYQKVISSEPNQALMQSYRDLTLAANGYQKVMSSTEASSNTINQFKSIVAEANGYQKVTKSATATTEQMNAAIHKVGLDLGNGKVALKLFTDDIKALGSALNNTKSTITNASSGIRNFTSSLSNTFKRILPSLGIPTSIAGITSAVKKAVTNTASYEESLNLFTMAVGEFTKEGRQWANTISEALYLDDSQILQYTGSFYNLTKGLGVANKQAFEMSKNLTQLSYDMSSYLNIDVSVANNKLMSAMSGQTKAVTSVGIAVQSASLQELAYEYGIKKSVQSMTQAEKTYLRYIQIMRSTKQMQGDLARTIITPTNAFRMLETQVVKLGRAIGQVLTPVIYNVLPALIALTNVLGRVAKQLASKFGYELQDIKYDGVNNATKAVKDLGKQATGTGKKLHQMLAPFDELNVVQSESSGSGGSSGSAGIDDALSGMVDGYDMLEGLNKKMSESIKDWEKKIENLLPKLKLLLEIILGFKALKKIINLFRGVATVFEAIKKPLKTVGTYMWYFWELLTQNSVLSSFIGKLGLLTSGVMSFITAIDANNTMLDVWKNNNYALDESIKITNYQTQLSISLAGALIGAINPIAGLITFLAGEGVILGRTIGTVKSEIEDLYTSDAMRRLNNNTYGTTIQQVISNFDTWFGKFETYKTNVTNLDSAIETNKQSLIDATDKLALLNATLEAGDSEQVKEAYKKLPETLDNVRVASDNLLESQRNRTNAEIDNLLLEGRITKEQYAEMTKSVKEYYDAQKTDTDKYYEKLGEYHKQFASHKISIDEYNKKVDELREKYSNVVGSLNNVSGAFDVYAGKLKYGIDINNTSAEKLKTNLDALKEKHDSYSKTVEETYNKDHEFNQQQIDHFAALMAQADKGSEKYKEYESMFNFYTTLDEELTKKKIEDMESLDATYADTLQAIYDEALMAGGEFSDEISGYMEDVEKELANIGDVDVSKSMGKYSDGVGKELLDMANVQEKNVTKGGKKLTEIYVNGMLVQIKDEKGNVTSSASDLAGYMTDGLGNTFTANATRLALKTKIENFISLLPDTIKKKLDIHSPSKVTEELGMYSIEGFANGLATKSSLKTIEDNVTKITDKVKDGLSKNLKTIDVDTKINIASDMSGSFNSILSKLQTFCNNWRNAINKLASETKETMNGIKVNNGKITYTSMPKITVNKFADGGFPETGQFFLAREAGPEYVGSIGNRTAVANNDQITTALTNAMVKGMTQVKSKETPNNVVVYIGDKKLYEGQGEYQSRQNDRYGTTVVRI